MLQSRAHTILYCLRLPTTIQSLRVAAFSLCVPINCCNAIHRRVIEYGLAERDALTLHFRPHPACEFCLFGSAGFIYHPTLHWRVCSCKAA